STTSPSLPASAAGSAGALAAWASGASASAGGACAGTGMASTRASRGSIRTGRIRARPGGVYSGLLACIQDHPGPRRLALLQQLDRRELEAGQHHGLAHAPLALLLAEGGGAGSDGLQQVRAGHGVAGVGHLLLHRAGAGGAGGGLLRFGLEP